MEYHVASLHGLTDAVGIADVSAEDLDLFHQTGIQGIEPTPIIEGIIEDERPDAATLRDQSFDQMRPDEPVRTGDEHSLSG
jgi:hypothetical protein